MATFPPPWELGCGPADPAISNINTQAPTGNGYARPVGRGTINAGNPITVPLAGAPAQVRSYVEPDGNLYFLGNVSGATFSVPPSAIVPPEPPVYSPTK
jgi:hypothetical protein